MSTTKYFTLSDNQWTLTSFVGNPTFVFRVVSVGGINEVSAGLVLGSSPTVYLRSDVMFYGGMGTKENPYKVTVDHDLLSSHVVDLYHDGSELKTVNIGGSSANPSVTQNSKQSIMLDNNGEYRYYGASPNNYVEFNDELWRIISVSNVKSDENDIVGSMRVKIIRDESIGEYSWDSSASTIHNGAGVNEWSRSDLMTELNTLYYNKESGTCYNGQNNASVVCNFMNIGLNNEAKNLISNALWYLGGNSISDLYANGVYTYERGTEVYNCSLESCGYERTTKWIGKIGIMYASDYMYATDLNVCTSFRYHATDSSLDYRNSNCTNNDWLYNETMHQWTLSSRSTLGSYVLYIDQTGQVGSLHTFYTFHIKPTIYLRSNVIFYGGNGSKSNPYQLNIV